MKNASNPSGSTLSKTAILKMAMGNQPLNFKTGTGAYRNARKLVKDGLLVKGKETTDDKGRQRS